MSYNPKTRQWHLYKHTALWHTPRNKSAFTFKGARLKGVAPATGSTVLAVDFTGDGLDDLALFEPRKNSFILAENKKSLFYPRKEALAAAAGSPGQLSPLAGEFNGDGLFDLAVVDFTNGKIGVALNNAGRFSRFSWQSPGLSGGNNLKALSGDFNGDRISDIALLDTSSGSWSILQGGTDGNFMSGEKPWLENWGKGNSWQVFAGDINGDSLCDIILRDIDGRWQTAASNGTGFTYSGTFGPWGAGQKEISLVADLNGDRKSDLIVAEGVGGKSRHLDTAISVMDSKAKSFNHWK